MIRYYPPQSKSGLFFAAAAMVLMLVVSKVLTDRPTAFLLTFLTILGLVVVLSVATAIRYGELRDASSMTDATADRTTPD